MSAFITILWILLYALLILFTCTFILSVVALRVTFRKENKGYDNRIYVETMNGNLDYSWYEKLPKEPFQLKSKHQYHIYGEILRNDVQTDKTVVIMHGYGANLIVSLKYARIFLERGFNVIVFDNTNCGKSGGRRTFMGFKEIDDLTSVIAKARSVFGENAPIGLHGESMGCATVTKYLERDPNIKFVVADCGFSNLFEQFSFILGSKYHIPRIPVTYFSSLLCKIRFGFFLSEFSPLKAMQNADGYSNIPMLFIHGELDDVVPCSCVYELYNAKKGSKQLAVYPQAHHARCVLKDKDRYLADIDSFLAGIDNIC